MFYSHLQAPTQKSILRKYITIPIKVNTLIDFKYDF